MARHPSKNRNTGRGIAKIANNLGRVNEARRDGYLTNRELLRELAIFAPNSGGAAHAKARLALNSAQRTFPIFCDLLHLLSRTTAEVQPIDAVCSDEASRQAAAEIGALFKSHGSDKSTAHDYHKFYGSVLEGRRNKSLVVLEIGLGTHNRDIVSYMQPTATIGGSLRAFRAFLPHAQLLGADIDRGILFEEDRIKTFYVDQTDLAAFGELDRQVADKSVDLFIDDGLHAPDANLTTLMFALDKLKRGGHFVVEDIGEPSLPIWKAVSAVMPANCSTSILAAKAGALFVVQKLDD